MTIILTALGGFCMALADSVPGVSGGTIAFILGFYEKFLNSLHNLLHGKGEERKEALRYLIKLGIGWAIGMICCVILLSSLFETHIYIMSSLFLGLTLCSIPFIFFAERKNLKSPVRHIWFTLLGIGIVIGLTMLRSGTGAVSGLSYAGLAPAQFLYLFISGAVAITAMVLPGISGSSILLIFGVYVPTITAVHSLLRLQLNVAPGIAVFVLGVLVGVVFAIRWIRAALQKHHSAMVYLILGLMIGALYAIINGPSSLDVPQPALSLATFCIPAFLTGVGILLALEAVKQLKEKYSSKNKAEEAKA